MRVIRFELIGATPTLNQTQRRHYHDRKKDKRALAWSIRLALGTQRPSQPFQRAHVLIERFSPGVPDRDNLVGGMKDLIDCLLCPGIRMVKGRPEALHPTGLGLIQDDAPEHMILDVRGIRTARGNSGRTVVVITELGNGREGPEPAPS